VYNSVISAKDGNRGRACCAIRSEMDIRQQAGQDKDHGNGCRQRAYRSHRAL
jgi:hypothetical protein